MTKDQKKDNENYFRRVLSMLKAGGIYTFPHISETYTIKKGKFYGSERGVREMKKITPKAFHKNILLQEVQNENQN